MRCWSPRLLLNYVCVSLKDPAKLIKIYSSNFGVCLWVKSHFTFEAAHLMNSVQCVCFNVYRGSTSSSGTISSWFFDSMETYRETVFAHLSVLPAKYSHPDAVRARQVWVSAPHHVLSCISYQIPGRLCFYLFFWMNFLEIIFCGWSKHITSCNFGASGTWFFYDLLKQKSWIFSRIH